jgi:hypothetical protein
VENLDITGHYDAAGMAFSITARAGRLVMVQPDVPADLNPVLEWIGPTAVRIMSGPFAGAELEFTVENGRVAGAVAGGVLPISVTDQQPVRPAGSGLRAPAYRSDAIQEAAFAAAWERTGDSGEVDLSDEYPAAAFVQWLMERDEFIFHGSTRSEIVEFRPRRESMEIGDVRGYGNLEAVYGTHDGLWAMFFAIVDRSRLRGSIRNGVGRYLSGGGAVVDLYRFSIEQGSLEDRPFCPGALYVFSRDPFDRLPLYPGGPPTNEWACPSSARPLARIPVEPDDFPFLDRIGGHDEGDFLRLSDVGDRVFARVTAAVRTPGGIRLSLDAGLDPAIRDEWIDLGRRFYPDVTRTLVDEDTVDLAGPRAFVHGIERRVADLLD